MLLTNKLSKITLGPNIVNSSKGLSFVDPNSNSFSKIEIFLMVSKYGQYSLLLNFIYSKYGYEMSIKVSLSFYIKAVKVENHISILRPETFHAYSWMQTHDFVWQIHKFLETSSCRWWDEQKESGGPEGGEVGEHQVGKAASGRHMQGCQQSVFSRRSCVASFQVSSNRDYKFWKLKCCKIVVLNITFNS